MLVTGQPRTCAEAWDDLPDLVRDRVGVLAIEMVFTSFVSGAAYSPPERIFPEPVQEMASNRSNRCLTEIHEYVEAALPDLFGQPGCDPDWVQQSERAA